jgi:hypothetical protein
MWAATHRVALPIGGADSARGPRQFGLCDLTFSRPRDGCILRAPSPVSVPDP